MNIPVKTTIKKTILSIIATVALLFHSCAKDDETPVDTTAKFAVAIASGKTDPNVIVPVENLLTDNISPIGKGLEQGGKRRYYYTINNTFISTDYVAGDLIGYNLVDGKLIEKGSLSFTHRRSLLGTADNNTLIVVNHPRTGIENRSINLIDTDKMVVTKTAQIKLDERADENMLSWPTGVKVKNGKMFISYMLSSDDGKFTTNNSNKARIAVLNYPALTLDKLISDDRGSDIGIYGNFNGLIKTENDDLYSYSSSSQASGYSPTPTNKSCILRIKKDDTDFDQTYYFDFETISGGHKISFMHYIGNNKALVKMVTDDSGLWTIYNPISDAPVLKAAIVDLETKEITKINDIPLHGGQWSTPVINHNGKVYMNVSDDKGAYIYEIDPVTAKATPSQKIEGSEVRGIFAIQ